MEPPRSQAHSPLKRWSILIAGWGFMLLGVAGLVLPFLQGFLFILIGLSLLSYEYHWARQLVVRVRERFPAMSAKLDRAEEWARTKLKSFRKPDP